MITSVFGLTTLDWKQVFNLSGYSLGSLPFWTDGLYKNSKIWDRHIAPSVMEDLRSRFDFSLPAITRTLPSSDGTVKFQMQFSDGLEVETVLLPFNKRYTVCLSTQVGCGMNCSFCFTGTQGLKRNLKAGEIVGQYLVAWNHLPADALRPSIVFMGQGEPLHNLAEVKKAIEILNDPKLIDLSLRQMTLSTVGYLPGLLNLENFPKVNFALSLHSPFEEERNILIPINQRYPLQDVLKALDALPRLKKQFITFEYLLIKNLNMTDRHAEGLSELLGHRPALVNLIAFNPFPGSTWERPDAFEIETFKGKLVAKKLRVMVRGTKGDDILAACGQLKINTMARSYV